MLASSVPSRPPIPFADSGAKNTIPTASQISVTPGLASLTDGFPPLTRTPIAAGGVPPFGEDMNGILNLVSAWARWQAAGGPVIYNSAFATAIGGYPAGAVLASTTAGRSWVNLVDGNTTDPDAGGANWARYGTGGLLSRQVITSTTTLTVPAGCTKARVYAIGATGGGGGSSSTGVGSPGGGAGYGIGDFTVTPGGSIVATIGAAGTAGTGGGSPTAGGAGGTTSFGASLSITGGTGGFAGSGAIQTVGGTGGTVSGADFGVSGQGAGIAVGFGGGVYYLGQPGGMFGGPPPQPVISSVAVNGQAGQLGVGGGGGALSGGGGAGFRGQIVVEWYA